MQTDSTNNGSGVGISLATAAAAGAVSFIPTLTQWFQLGAAVLAFIAAAIGLYKAIKK
jgi:hypothetical protein